MEQWERNYNLVQYIVGMADVDSNHQVWAEITKRTASLPKRVNSVLEQEGSAYRFVAKILTEITDGQGILAVEEAVKLQGPFSPVRIHIATALQLFSNRDAPDFRNSIKESISAVEATFFLTNGKKSPSLTEALKLAEKRGFSIHPALRNGIISIYGWASDEPGVRHASILDTANVTADEARLMLVLCSAFVNYMSIKHEGLTFEQSE